MNYADDYNGLYPPHAEPHPSGGTDFLYYIVDDWHQAVGIGRLIAGDYLPVRGSNFAAVFCPSAEPSNSSYKQKGASQNFFTAISTPGRGSLASTYVGKFCTYSGGVGVTIYSPGSLLYMDRVQTQTASKISPILVMDWIMDKDSFLPSSANGKQGHNARGVNAAFYDGSASWIGREEITPVNNLYDGVYSNRAAYSNVWYWATQEFAK